MTAIIDPRNKGLAVDTERFGYRIEEILALKEINALLYKLVHLDTGARHLHVSSDDKENSFGVTFKTVPTDSTGVAHILEHTVLCGSRKFPVRDPFFSMLKRSLSTFMNAFTASDWTMYPFCTQNAKDYYNLMDVYLDATFFADLAELSFKQEGHRLETEADPLDAQQARLVYKGVVYNEMKGAMSSPDQVMGRSLLHALYPDTTYSNNSGGDPKAIPELTHRQLTNFHKRHYHPSNAYFFTYGNLPLEDHLQFIATKIMQHFSRIDPETEVPPQPRWSAHKEVQYTYALAPSQNTAKKCQVALAWLMCDIRDTFNVLVLTVLEQILLGNAASPLRKALMDSGLGSALNDAAGFDASNRDTLFACGLKETDEASAGKIEALVFDVLRRLVKEGIDPELIDSAIHQIEFHRKEITNTPYPYGLKLLLSVIGSWLHGGQPERILKLDADLDRLKKKIAKGPFLEGAIQSYFLDNPHRIRLLLAPDPHKAQLEARKTRQALDALEGELTTEQLEQISRDAAELKSAQERQEDLACLPTLALDDIPPEVPTYAPSKASSKMPLWCYGQATSGIFYFNAGMSAVLPSELLPWAPLFCYAFTKMGSRRNDYTAIARKIDSVTGGLSLSANVRVPRAQPDDCLPLLYLNAKCLNRNIDPMLGLAEELIAAYNFENLDRLEQLTGEYLAGLEAMVVHNGSRLAISLSSRTFTPACALGEIWSGVHQLRTIRKFSQETNAAKFQILAEQLAAIAEAVFKPDNFAMAAIGEPEWVERSLRSLEQSSVLSGCDTGGPTPALAPMPMKLSSEIPREGWSTSTAVAFVAQTIPTVPLGHADAPTMAVLAKIVRSLYLHREIREKGGAYGGLALYNPESGLFSLASYRDPHIARTLEIFDGLSRFMRSKALDDEDISEAVLQVCSEIDTPDPPGPAARKAFARLLVGLSDKERLAFKQRLLKVTRKQILEAVATYFDAAGQTPGVAVIAADEHLQRDNSRLGSAALKTTAI